MATRMPPTQAEVDEEDNLVFAFTVGIATAVGGIFILYFLLKKQGSEASASASASASTSASTSASSAPASQSAAVAAAGATLEAASPNKSRVEEVLRAETDQHLLAGQSSSAAAAAADKEDSKEEDVDRPNLEEMMQPLLIQVQPMEAEKCKESTPEEKEALSDECDAASTPEAAAEDSVAEVAAVTEAASVTTNAAVVEATIFTEAAARIEAAAAVESTIEEEKKSSSSSSSSWEVIEEDKDVGNLLNNLNLKPSHDDPQPCTQDEVVTLAASQMLSSLPPGFLDEEGATAAAPGVNAAASMTLNPELLIDDFEAAADSTFVSQARMTLK